MSVRKGGQLIAGSVDPDKYAKTDLSNLDANGQAKFDAKANVDLSNLNATGQAKLDAKLNTDASNFTATVKQTVVGWGLPNWGARVGIGTNYTFVAKGWLLVWQYTIPGGVTYLNGQEILRSEGGHDYLGANYNTIFIPVDVGDTLTGAITGAIFIPCKGA